MIKIEDRARTLGTSSGGVEGSVMIRIVFGVLGTDLLTVWWSWSRETTSFWRTLI